MSEWEIIETEDAMPIVNALKEKTKIAYKKTLEKCKDTENNDGISSCIRFSQTLIDGSIIEIHSDNFNKEIHVNLG